MKIVRYKKLSSGLYDINLSDNRNVKLYDDIILKYNLLLSDNLDSETLEMAINDNKYYEYYYLALKYIKTRRRCVGEVHKKLIDSGCSCDSTFDILNKLIFQGYLNDSDYASSFVHEQIMTTSRGPLKIKMELLKRGVESSIVDSALALYDDNIQREKLTKIISKNIKGNKTRSSQMLKKKVVNDLLAQGFSNDIILSVYDSFDSVSDDDIREREYNKLYTKLSRKYSGLELEVKLREKMYQKGFKI